MKRGHLTSGEKRKIRRLTLAGWRQSKIARHLRITAPSVSKTQRAMGLPTIVPIDESEVERLFKAGCGGYQIAKHLRVSVPRIYEVLHRRGLRRDGRGSEYAGADVVGFIAAVKNRSDYINRLAEKFHIGICKAQRIAREVLNCPEFRPGLSKPPLSSNFPQKYFETFPGVVSFDQLAEAAVRRFYVRGVSADTLCDAIMQCVPCLVSASADAKENFANQFRHALRSHSVFISGWIN